MLDYFFCEECQTYHRPNRILDGQFLSACQCQVKMLQQNQNIKNNQNSDRTMNYSKTPQLQKPLTKFNLVNKVNPIQSNYKQNTLRYNQKNGFHRRDKIIQQMPFINILYKNKNQQQENKETQYSAVINQQKTIKKNQSASILVKAQPFLKSCPLNQKKNNNNGNSLQYSPNQLIQKAIPLLKTNTVKPVSHLQNFPELKSFPEFKQYKSQQVSVKCRNYDSVIHKSRKGYKVQNYKQQICCDHKCFYF